jgi:hypothetical protein
MLEQNCVGFWRILALLDKVKTTWTLFNMWELGLIEQFTHLQEKSKIMY